MTRGFAGPVCGITWGWGSTRGAWAGGEAAASLAALAATGANWVTIAFGADQRTINSTTIDWREAPTVSTAEVRWAIRAAHGLGLQVCLKPVVNCADGTWRAHIGFLDEVPGEPTWQEWFGAYTEFLTHFARIAEEERCELLCVGCEYVRSEVREREWRDVVDRVRDAFSGPLTYNCDKYQEDRLTWWDAVDVISSSGYYPPRTLTAQFDRIEAVVHRWDKPFLFLEAGCPSRSGAAAAPNDWSRPGLPGVAVQHDYLRQFLAECRARPWVDGVMIWDWPARLYPIGSAHADDGYCIYGKPAEQLVKDAYTAWKNNA